MAKPSRRVNLDHPRTCQTLWPPKKKQLPTLEEAIESGKEVESESHDEFNSINVWEKGSGVWECHKYY